MRLLLLLLTAAALHAGGFFLTLADPPANPDPKAKAAFVIVSTAGCHRPEEAVVTATAEGIINGQRHSIPLEVVALKTAGTYAVKTGWTQPGPWFVKVTATIGELQTHSLIKVTDKGFDKTQVRTNFGPFGEEKLVAMMR